MFYWNIDVLIIIISTVFIMYVSIFHSQFLETISWKSLILFSCGVGAKFIIFRLTVCNPLNYEVKHNFTNIANINTFYEKTVNKINFSDFYNLRKQQYIKKSLEFESLYSQRIRPRNASFIFWSKLLCYTSELE